MTDKQLMETKDWYEIELISFHGDMNHYQHMEFYADTLEEAKTYGIRLAEYHTRMSGFDWDVSELRKLPNYHKIEALVTQETL